MMSFYDECSNTSQSQDPFRYTQNLDQPYNQKEIENIIVPLIPPNTTQFRAG